MRLRDRRAPRAIVWAAITGALAAVPFLGYVAVAAMVLQLALQGAASSALLSLMLGCLVLLCGDKVVRPMVARQGIACPSCGCSWRALVALAYWVWRDW